MKKPIYLLDTNIVSELGKPNPDKNVLAHIYEKKDLCAIAATTWQELAYGINIMPESKKKKYLYNFIIDYVQATFPIINYDNHCAWIQADIRDRLKSIGKVEDEKTGYADTEIASIAISNQMILVTRNTKHFALIQSVDSVFYLENWFE